MSSPVETERTVPKEISEMSDRELAEETVMWLRTVGQAIAQLQKVGPGGMLKAMMKGGIGG
jgi:hypothetical protein